MPSGATHYVATLTCEDRKMSCYFTATFDSLPDIVRVLDAIIKDVKELVHKEIDTKRASFNDQFMRRHLESKCLAFATMLGEHFELVSKEIQ
jgi:hypothetical protein